MIALTEILQYKTYAIDIVGGACRLREVQLALTPGFFDPRFMCSSTSGIKRDSLFNRLNFVMAEHFHHVENAEVLYYNPMINAGVSINIPPTDEAPSPSCDMAMLALFAMSSVNKYEDMKLAFCGEVGINGDFRPLSIPLAVGRLAKQYGLTVFVPEESAMMVSMAGADTVAVRDAFWLWSTLGLYDNPYQLQTGRPQRPPYETPLHDLSGVRGRVKEAHALEVAVAGGHNILFCGPPGQGKSMLAKCVPGIAPPLSWDEVIEVSSLWQQAGKTEGLITQRQVRVVDPSITKQALIGGGSDSPCPGEVSLAHRGTLFLDEFPQMMKSVIESLRGPIQDGEVSLSRVSWKITFPSQFQLVASCNPCPCGYWMHGTKACICTPSERKNYLKKLSGPLIDRIPIRVWTQPLTMKQIQDGENGEPSAQVAERVEMARTKQEKRWGAIGLQCNDELEAQHITQDNLQLDTGAQSVLSSLDDGLSPRAVHNLLKVARTVADLRDAEYVGADDIDRAITLMTVENIPILQ